MSAARLLRRLFRRGSIPGHRPDPDATDVRLTNLELETMPSLPSSVTKEGCPAMDDPDRAYLSSRLDEDEQTALEAVKSHEREPRMTPCSGGARWRHRYDEDDYGGTEVVDEDGHVVVPLASDYGGAVRVHVARWDPARALAQVQRDRGILDEHALEDGCCRTCTTEDREVLWDGETEEARWVRKPVASPCRTRRLLALPYADRDDFPETLRLSATYSTGDRRT